MKRKEQLGGLYSASITAYDASGRIDGAALQRVMERNWKEGAAGFFVGGSSGECFLLTEGERVEVFEAASAFAGRTNLIAHVGAISTDEAVRYAKAAIKHALARQGCPVGQPRRPFSALTQEQMDYVDGVLDKNMLAG